jgi:hypothetical protein
MRGPFDQDGLIRRPSDLQADANSQAVWPNRRGVQHLVPHCAVGASPVGHWGGRGSEFSVAHERKSAAQEVEAASRSLTRLSLHARSRPSVRLGMTYSNERRGLGARGRAPSVAMARNLVREVSAAVRLLRYFRLERA